VYQFPQGKLNAISIDFMQNKMQWGLVNFDCSGLWVRDRNNLTEALDITPAYLRTKQGDSGMSRIQI
jgi:aromatic-L-amino-acid decarboxylase